MNPITTTYAEFDLNGVELKNNFESETNIFLEMENSLFQAWFITRLVYFCQELLQVLSTIKSLQKILHEKLVSMLILIQIIRFRH